MKRVLFVCMGNICRSPAAAGLFGHYVAARRLSGEVEVDSAGTIAYHAGEPPDGRMRRAAAARGYTLGGASRQVHREDFERFDLLVAMDRENLRDLEEIANGSGAPIVLFSDFLSPEAPADVPDPYYGGPDGFDRVLDLIEEGCPALLAHLTTS